MQRVYDEIEELLMNVPGQARIPAFHCPDSEEMISVVEQSTTSPVSFSVASDLSITSGVLEPQASTATIGMKFMSAPCRTDGSMPTSIAMPAMMNACTCASRRARLRYVLSNADMVILSIRTSSSLG